MPELEEIPPAKQMKFSVIVIYIEDFSVILINIKMIIP